MKKLYLLFFLSASLISYSQEYGSNFPKATVTSERINNSISYSFISNYLIDEYKAPLLEKRFLDRYSELLEIKITYDTQTVSFKVLNNGSNLFLENFVKHFKYNGYEIH